MLDLLFLFLICIGLTLDPTAVPKLFNKYQLGETCEDNKYSIVLDAGSTGSRIHVYRFCGTLKNEIFEQTTPGLSTLGADEGGPSIVNLVQVALDSIPSHLHKCTPIQLQATAGLRLLPDGGHAIIKRIKQIFSYYPFYMLQVEVMSGIDEALFAWLTINYLAENFKKTAAIIDLGGASTQIVFENADYTTKYTYLSDYELYANSFLGYGLHEALDTVKETMGVFDNPCLNEGVKDYFNKHGKSAVFHGPKVSKDGPLKCRDMIYGKLFLKHEECEEEEIVPCRMNLHFPSIDDFTNDIYAFSYIYDLTHLDGMKFKEKSTINAIIELQQQLCDYTLKKANLIENVVQLREKKPLACMQLSYVVELLLKGYGLKETRELIIVKKMKDLETGWALGAALKSLDTVKTCQN